MGYPNEDVIDEEEIVAPPVVVPPPVTAPPVTTAAGASPLVPSAPSDAQAASLPPSAEDEKALAADNVPVAPGPDLGLAEGELDPHPERADIVNPKTERQEYNSRRLALMKTRGIKHYQDPASGLIVPERDEAGKLRYEEHTGPVEYDQAGQAIRKTRDETGVVTVTALDAKAKIGTHPDTPNVLYKQNKNAGWDYLGTVDEGLQSEDPAVKGAAEKAKLNLDRQMHGVAAEALGKNVYQAAEALKEKLGAYQAGAKTLVDLNTKLEAANADPRLNEEEGGFLGIGRHPTGAALELQKERDALSGQVDALRKEGISTEVTTRANGALAKFLGPEKAALAAAHSERSAWGSVRPNTPGELDKIIEERRVSLAANGVDPASDPVILAIETRQKEMALKTPASVPTVTAWGRSSASTGLYPPPSDWAPMLGGEEAKAAVLGQDKISTTEQVTEAPPPDVTPAPIPTAAPVAVPSSSGVINKTYTVTPDNKLRFQPGHEVGGMAMAVQDGLLLKDDFQAQRNAAAKRDDDYKAAEKKISEDWTGNIPKGLYQVANGKITFQRGDAASSIISAMRDGAITPDYVTQNLDKARQADDEYNKLMGEAGNNQQLKAAIDTGVKSYVRFQGGLAASALVAPWDPELAAIGAPFGGVGAVVPPAIAHGVAFLIGQYVTGKATDAIVKRITNYSSLVSSLESSAKLHPNYAAAGEMAGMAPAAVASITGFMAAAKRIAERNGSKAAARFISTRLASGAGAGVIFETTVRPAFDALTAAAGGSDEFHFPTFKSVIEAAFIGAVLNGEQLHDTYKRAANLSRNAPPETADLVRESVQRAKRDGISPEFRAFFGGIDPEVAGTTHEKVAAFAKSLGMEYRPKSEVDGMPSVEPPPPTTGPAIDTASQAQSEQDSLTAAHTEIDSLQPNENLAPEQVAPTQTALRGLVKIGQGQPIEALTAAERAAVTAKHDDDGLPRVEMVKGPNGSQAVITDAALERVAKIAPTVRALLPQDEGSQRQAVLEPPAAVTTSPGNKSEPIAPAEGRQEAASGPDHEAKLLDAFGEDAQHAFLGSDGALYNRAEAAQIASAAGQIPAGAAALQSDQLGRPAQPGTLHITGPALVDSDGKTVLASGGIGDTHKSIFEAAKAEAAAPASAAQSRQEAPHGTREGGTAALPTFAVEVQDLRGETRIVEVQAADAKAARAQVSATIPFGRGMIRGVEQIAAPPASGNKSGAGAMSHAAKEADFVEQAVQQARQEQGRELTPQEQTAVRVVAHVMRPHVERWQKAFDSITASLSKMDSGGAGFTRGPGGKGALVISVPDVIHHYGHFQSDPAHGDRIVTEEALHAISTSLDTRHGGPIDFVKLFRSYPKALQEAIKNAYAPGSSDYQFAHEGWRMFLAGAVELAAGRRVRLNGKFLQEQTSREFVSRHRRALAEILKFIRSGEDYLRKHGASEDVIAEFVKAKELSLAKVKEIDAHSRGSSEETTHAQTEDAISAERPDARGPPEGNVERLGTERTAPGIVRAGGSAEETAEAGGGSGVAAGPAGPEAGEQLGGSDKGRVTGDERQKLAASLNLAPEVIGAKSRLSQNGQTAEVVFVAQDASAARPSHDIQGRATPGYDQSLQPRDRSLAVYRKQSQNIANNLDFAQAAFFPETDVPATTADLGAPVMTLAGDTLIGNGREIGIKAAYESSSPAARRYKRDFVRNAAKFGIDSAAVMKMGQPILKRVIISELSKPELVRLSQESNAGPAMASNALETARQDASRITPGLLSLFDPNFGIDSQANADFVRVYTRDVIRGEGANEANLTKSDLTRRIRAAVFAHAYGMDETGRAAMERMAGDEADTGGKTITGGLLTAAPLVARLRADIANGDVYAVDIAAAVGRAAQDINEALRNRPAKQSAADALSGLRDQREMLQDYDAQVNAAVRDFLIEHRTNRAEIEQALSNFVEGVYALGNPKQPDLLGERAVPTALEVWQNASRPEALDRSAQRNLAAQALISVYDSAAAAYKESDESRNKRERNRAFTSTERLPERRGIREGADRLVRRDREPLGRQTARVFLETSTSAPNVLRAQKLDEQGRDERLISAFGVDWGYGWDKLGFPISPRPLRDGHPLLRHTDKLERAQLTKESKAVRLGLLSAGVHSRSDLRDAIEDYFLRGGDGKLPIENLPGATASGNPEALVMGGGGGAGKSSLLRKMEEEGNYDPANRVRIDADLIREFLPEYERLVGLGDARASEFTHKEASDSADELTKRAVEQGLSLTLDGTLKSKAKNLAFIRELKAEGYHVRLLAVTVDPYEAVVRTYLRGRENARYVPPVVTLDAHRGFNASLPAYLRELPGDAIVYDNTPAYALRLNSDEVLSGAFPEVAKRAQLNPTAGSVNELLQSYGKTRETVGQLLQAQPLHSQGTLELFADYADALPVAAKVSRPALKRQVAKDVPALAGDNAALGELFALTNDLAARSGKKGENGSNLGSIGAGTTPGPAQPAQGGRRSVRAAGAGEISGAKPAEGESTTATRQPGSTGSGAGGRETAERGGGEVGATEPGREALGGASVREDLRAGGRDERPAGSAAPLARPLPENPAERNHVIARGEFEPFTLHSQPTWLKPVDESSRQGVVEGDEQSTLANRRADPTGNLGRALEAAALHARRGDGTGEAVRDNAGEGAALVRQGVIPEFNYDAIRSEIERLGNAGRNEHEVLYEEGAERVYKLTKPGEFGARGGLFDYLRRLQEHNELFGDAIHLEGAAKDPETAKYMLVTSQPWIRGRPATKDEIEQYFAAKGFVRYSDRAFYNPATEMLVSDAEGHNVLTDNSGAVHPIDLVPEHPVGARLEMIQNVVRAREEDLRAQPLNPEENPELDFSVARADAEKSALQRFQETLPLAMKIAGTFSNVPGVEISDVRQHARIALVKAARAYDGNRGAPFAALARVSVNNALRGLYRKQARNREETTLEEVTSDEGQVTSPKEQIAAPNDTVGEVAHREGRRILNDAITELPERMQGAMRGILTGETLEEIGAGMGGITRQAVGRLVTEAMRRLRGKLGEKGVSGPSDLLAQPTNNIVDVLSDERLASLPQEIGRQARAFEQAAKALYRGTGSPTGEGTPARSAGRDVEKWAREHNALIPPEVIERLPVVANQTSEHEVRFRASDQRVVKRTWAGVYGQIPFPENGKLGRRNASPSEYLHRMALQVAVFGSDLRFEGVSISDKPSMIIGQPAGEPSLVVSQPWLAKEGRASNAEISQYLIGKGFRAAPNSYFGWARPDGIVLVDAKPDNFIKTSDGIVPFDLQLAEFTPAEMAQAGLKGASPGDLLAQPTVGMKLTDVGADFPADDADASLLNVSGSNAEIVKRSVQVFNSWPRTMSAADGSPILLHNPERGSLGARVRHLLFDNQRHEISSLKAQWMPMVPPTLQNAAIRLVDGKTGNRVYVRQYRDGQKHMVVVEPNGEVLAQESFTGALITQFRDLQPSRHGTMRIDWVRPDGRETLPPSPGTPPSATGAAPESTGQAGQKKTIAKAAAGQFDTLERIVNTELKAQETDDPIAQLMALLDSDAISALQERAAAETPGQRTIGRPDLSLGAEGPAIMGVDEARKATHTPQTEEGWLAEAHEMLARDYEGTARLLAARALAGGTLSAAETKAAQLIVAREMAAPLTAESRQRVQALIWAYRQTGTAAARSLGSRQDPFKTPAERNREFLAKVIFTPPARVRAEMGSGNQETRKRLLEKDQERINKIEAELKKMGISFDDILSGGFVLHGKGKELIQQGLEAYDVREQQALRLAQTGTRTAAEIAKMSGLGAARVREINDQFIDGLREKLRAKVAAGLTLENIDLQGALLAQETGRKTPEEVEAELDRIIKGMGFVPSEQLGTFKVARRKTPKAQLFRPPAVPYTGPVPDDSPVPFEERAQNQIPFTPEQAFRNVNPPPGGPQEPIAGPTGRVLGQIGLPLYQEMMVRKGADVGSVDDVVKIARMVQAANGNAFDMAYEAWINGILSGPQTHVANIAGNALNAGLDFSLQRGMEALVNLVYRDPKSAQLGEFRHIVKGMAPGWARAISLAQRAWAAEADFSRHDVLNEQVEMFEDFDKGGGARPSIPGQTGRAVRMPSRALFAEDAMFKGLIEQMEVGAQAYRIAKAEGLKGEPLSARMNELIDTPNSEAWQRAAEKATYLTFQDEIPTKEKGGNLLDNAVARLSRARSGSYLLGYFFPFIRTPYNIFKIGLRKTPLGTANMAAKFAKSGFYKIKDGKPVFESYTKARQVRDLAEQIIAWTTFALLWGATTGDDDDDKKQFLLVGSFPRNETKQGERDLNMRAYGGEYQMRIGGRNGVYLNYGRYEPVATVLGTVVDAIVNLKKLVRGKLTPSEALDAMHGYFMAQAESKTFLQSFGNIADLTRGKISLTGFAEKQLFNAFVPNLIRQPLRNLDQYVRDYKTAGPAYQLVPAGSLAQPKIDVYGKPIAKGGNMLSRLLFAAGTKPYPKLEQADALLLNWNRNNPRETWAPQEANTKGMSAPEKQRYLEAVGKRVLADMPVLSRSQIERPLEEDKEAVKRVFEKARREVKHEMFGGRDFKKKQVNVIREFLARAA